MGKGQKQIQQTATQRSTEQYAVGKQGQQDLQNNPDFKARQARVAERRAAIDAGDLANAKDFMSNKAKVAERMRGREARTNLTKTGVAGLASNYANPTQIALADQLYKDEFARDSAAQTEADARDYISQTEAMETDIINTGLGISSNVMNAGFGTANNNLQMAAQVAASRASILPSILGAAIQGGAAVATGSNWFQRGAGAGAAGAPG